MNTIFTDLRSALRKHAAYRRTVHELRGLPRSMAEDLAIFPGDEERIARTAVYGA